MKETPTVDSAQVWGDDGLDEVNNKIGLVTLELTVKELTLATQAALLGHSYVSGVVSRGMNDIVPYVAVGWVGKKTNNHFRYQWYLKGKFEVPTNSNETEADKIKLQPAIIKGTFFPRKFDLLLERVIDQDDPSYIPSQGTNWFSYVESSPTTLTCVAAPIQGATAVPKHLPTITWTYSNAIAGGQLIPGNFSIIATTTGVAVAGALTIDATNKIVTFTPTADLAATTMYMAIADNNVDDCFGQHMAANTTDTFTTGA
jgi:phi13 family phage major tail protein